MNERQSPGFVPNAPEREVDDGSLRGHELRDRMAEKMLRFLDAAERIDAFQGKRAEEVLANEETRRQFISGLSPQDYIQLLIGINGILRNRDRSEWGMDGKDVVIGSQ